MGYVIYLNRGGLVVGLIKLDRFTRLSVTKARGSFEQLLALLHIHAAGCTPRTGYTYCVVLTQVHTQVGGTNSSSFPVGLIGTCNGSSGTGFCSGSNLDLRTAANGGMVQNTIPNGGLMQESYTSGGSFSGTGLCTLSSFSNATGATGTIVVTSGTPSTITITAPGTGATTGAFTATVASGGGATCSGTVSGDGRISLFVQPADIAITSDSSGTTLIPWEVASYTATTGQIEIYQKENISHTADTLSYLQVKNSSQTTYANQGQLLNTWDSNFVAVYHGDLATFNGASFAKQYDSTTNNQVLAANPSSTNIPQITGVAGHGWQFTSTNILETQLVPAAGLFPSGSAARTTEIWFNRNGTASSSNSNVEIGVGWGNNSTMNQWGVPQTCTATACGTPVYDCCGIGFFGNGCWITVNPGTDSNWHYSADTLPSGTTVASVILYYDGTAQSITCGNTASTINTTDPHTAAFFAIGVAVGNTVYTQYLDEVRISNVGRSADWILSTRNNLNTPGSFVTSSNVSTGAAPPPFGIINQ